jgi:hypothetical protein
LLSSARRSASRAASGGGVQLARGRRAAASRRAPLALGDGRALGRFAGGGVHRRGVRALALGVGERAS